MDDLHEFRPHLAPVPPADGTGAASERIDLAGRHALEVVHEDDRDLLRLSSPGDGVGLTITVNDAGIAIHLSGADVVLRANGRLAIDARELALHSREGLVLSSDADAAIQVRGDLHSEARIQRIRARLGDVDISANDDVHLRGEQIKLNT